MTTAANQNESPCRKGLFGALSGFLARRRREAASVRALMELSDHTLRDIGLSRYDVMRAARSGGYPARLGDIRDANIAEQVHLARRALAITPVPARAADTARLAA